MDALIFFAKYPTMGRVKTRLGAVIGMESATSFYRQMFERLVGQLRPDTNYELVLCFDPPEKLSQFQSEFPNFSAYWAQQGEDLGERMLHAFRRAFAQGFTRVVLVGSDCLAITHEKIQQAFQSLVNCDVLLGPSVDGGYYLIGLTQPQPKVFYEIPWSSSTVFAATLAQVKAQELRYELLTMEQDIDTYEDYRKLWLPLNHTN